MLSTRIIFSRSHKLPRDKKFAFRRIKESSVSYYSSVLHRLIYNLLRYYIIQEWNSSYSYPQIDASQSGALERLYSALEEQESNHELDERYHDVCYVFFAHEKHQYESSWQLKTKFFSPVICFLTIHCITEYGGTPNCSGISNIVAPIMYSIRACVFRKVLARLSKERISASE